MHCPYCASKPHHRYGWYPDKMRLHRFKCLRCGKVFTSLTNPDPPPFRHTLRIISLAMKCYLHYGLSFRKVAELLYDLYNLKISHTTIAHWFRRFVKQVVKFQWGLKLPSSGQWHLDETFVKLQGRWHYIFAIVSEWHRTLFTLRIMPHRTRKAVIQLLKELKKQVKLEKRVIVTDGL
ncbi:MAG: DDE-type integrase/transposase/recombinase [Candidatus Hodarchaeota archaeon]